MELQAFLPENFVTHIQKIIIRGYLKPTPFSPYNLKLIFPLVGSNNQPLSNILFRDLQQMAIISSIRQNQMAKVKHI
jgi:hypothetical protein